MGASASVDQVQIICSNVERAVPRTPAGDRDVKNCDRTKLQEEISRAEGEVKAFYEAAWATCVADDLLQATAALHWPRSGTASRGPRSTIAHLR
jgi:hypothetical protein